MKETIEPLPEQTFFSPVFDLVKDPSNWKNPINAIVAAPGGAGDFLLWCQVVERAIEFYAGGGTKIEVLGLSNNGLGRKVRVTAPGYYNLIGA